MCMYIHMYMCVCVYISHAPVQHCITGTFLALLAAHCISTKPAFGHNKSEQSHPHDSESAQSYLQPSLGGGLIHLQRLTDSLV